MTNVNRERAGSVGVDGKGTGGRFAPPSLLKEVTRSIHASGLSRVGRIRTVEVLGDRSSGSNTWPPVLTA